MANKRLFGTNAALLAPPADAVNEAGGRAYALSPRHALAQYAATGCLNATFYASAEQQLATLLALCEQVTPEFIAKTAVYCRERGLMKDVPALLCAVLAVRDARLLARVFPRVIDDARMLRSFVQIVRSGQVGRRSLGTAPKRLVREWLAARTDEQLFRAAVGQDPSLADLVKMVHPRPATPAREALYAYLIGKAGAEAMALLPETVQRFEAFKAARANGAAANTDGTVEPPDVPFQMLTALNLGTADWTAIARRATWQQTRINLNTFARHGVFEVEGMAELVAAKLCDEQAIARARVFPYQLLAAYQAAGPEIPVVVRQALHTAMEVATRNVPALPGKVYILLDVSGSMSAPVSGWRKGATTKLRCIDVAALVAAAILRTNPHAEVIAFNGSAIEVALHAELPVMANAERLAALLGGGTNCLAPLALLNRRKAEADLVIFVSDMESWMDRWGRGYAGATGTMHEWQALKARNPRARLACIDLQAYGTTQAQEREEVLNVGGFSDQVFELLGLFARGELTAEHWVGAIDAVEI